MKCASFCNVVDAMLLKTANVVTKTKILAASNARFPTEANAAIAAPRRARVVIVIGTLAAAIHAVRSLLLSCRACGRGCRD